MNERDLQILSCLRQNSRMKLTEISRKTGIPVSTIYDKLKAFNEKGIIKNTTLLNFPAIGYNIRVMMLIKATDDSKQIEEFLTNHLNVSNTYKISDEYDFIIDCVFRSTDELKEFTTTIDKEHKITNIKTYRITENKQREAFSPLLTIK